MNQTLKFGEMQAIILNKEQYEKIKKQEAKAQKRLEKFIRKLEKERGKRP